ncbi:lysine transporter LysE [Vandammella animalimorsus]|uniref:Lysine transporter LysE n=2 Tax=Vandammella animalimorsus TaxID=2029117 RepID=A0A2A2ANN5_9BURK|nr:lysine transporter LysE [Vandammella animalimorsus]
MLAPHAHLPAPMPSSTTTTFLSGLALSLSLIMAIGPQNAHVLRMGLLRQHVLLTVLMSVAADCLLIFIGVYGLAQFGHMPDKVHGALVGAGVLFLLMYGWQALQRFWRAQRTARHQDAAAQAIDDLVQAPAAPLMGRGQAMATALAFSCLNPHAWLDTAVLIGSASLAYGSQAMVFGLGAMAASLLWFTCLGGASAWLGQRINTPRLWIWLDGLVAVMMWGLAWFLARSLFKS